MPYKNSTLKLVIPRKFDARVKLSLDDRELIKKLYGHISQRNLAHIFGVSRRLITLYGDDEKYQRNLAMREQRGGSKIYYDKDMQRRCALRVRHKRQALYLDGKLTTDKAQVDVANKVATPNVSGNRTTQLNKDSNIEQGDIDNEI